MREHPITPVTEPLQYRAIGVVRGIYHPSSPEKFTKGTLEVCDENQTSIESVVLGRVIGLMQKHLALNEPHLWVVYPRCRDSNYLHLQIAGVWEPSTLKKQEEENVNKNNSNEKLESKSDHLPEGENYFSIRGELIFTRPETEELVIRIRQKGKDKKNKGIPFKIMIKGNLPLEYLRHFVSIEARRINQQLHLESFEVISQIPQKTTKGKGEKRKNSPGKNHESK